ncbi:hypothetical protein C8247_11425 [Paracidovorax avenae]|uniref:hypothetical protein n=1 Tax=Paracidovorax avenae TaxID=80867 RepID=UPI000D160A8C|nr:hypothetical protein [Paracidovorax avenae]AVS70979.1 hypothetical protein C8247_11425 [Paracidovorax avenae]
MNNFDLPEGARLIADAIGRRAALYLVGRTLRWDAKGHRGRVACIYIPKKLKPCHALIGIVGVDAAAVLVRELGGLVLKLYPCQAVVMRWHRAEATRLRRAGLGPTAVAAVLGVSARQAASLLAESD